MVVGRLLSYWEGTFSWAMLVRCSLDFLNGTKLSPSDLCEFVYQQSTRHCVPVRPFCHHKRRFSCSPEDDVPFSRLVGYFDVFPSFLILSQKDGDQKDGTLAFPLPFWLAFFVHTPDPETLTRV